MTVFGWPPFPQFCTEVSDFSPCCRTQEAEQPSKISGDSVEGRKFCRSGETVYLTSLRFELLCKRLSPIEGCKNGMSQFDVFSTNYDVWSRMTR